MARRIFRRTLFQGSAPPASPWPGSEGFSLLEVLVATALMGLVLVVLLQVLTSALRAQEASWSHTQALLTAEKMWLLSPWSEKLMLLFSLTRQSRCSR